MEFKLPDQGEEVKGKIEEAGMSTLAYDAQFKFFRVSIDQLDMPKQRSVLQDLIQKAWELYGKP
jgi:hypothetical protein